MRGGAPPDLKFAELACPAVAANTVTAFLNLIPAPGVGRAIRVWIIGVYGNAAVTPPASPAKWFADFIYNGPASRFGRCSGDSFAMRTLEFPGGFRHPSPDNRPVDVRFQADIANPPITAVIYYTLEEV